ncbi:MAG: hypothetical protein KME12_20840 [Trichocoleus desertorum ATA4-8-CV12]|jgi:CRISPR-associated protein Cmr2|nr:hypothetical protein [Trichocoleus desertorum ATA4-8-CV12]
MTDTDNTVYTAITFAPVQGFIEKSRKLRDLYGSSYLLSLLAQSICVAVGEANVVSPALPNITQGMPNQIIVRGQVSQVDAEKLFFDTWSCITDTCRQWIEDNVQGNWQYSWDRDWGLWAKYAWEFFHVVGKPGESITQVRQRLNEKKRSRAWIGVNWQGESSTLSGTDAVAWAELGKIAKPHEQTVPWEKDRSGKSPVEHFYVELSCQLGAAFIKKTPELAQIYHNNPQRFLEKSIEYGEAFIDPDEELSIPELIKRLITHKAIVEQLIERMGSLYYLTELKKQIEKDLNPKRFTDLNRLQHKSSNKPQYWTGWFQGDGDGASDYLKWLGEQGSQQEDRGTTAFSTQMRCWGQEFKENATRYLPNDQSRLIYAGGDDFLGVLYQTDAQLPAKDCLDWFSTFKSGIWEGINPTQPEKQITASVGFVWVSPKVPQRDVLQHCREAEKSAKHNGKDRIAFRIVFSGGNYLEWVCPWRILEDGLFRQYRDRNGMQGEKANWTHFYNDVAVLESRHSFGSQGEEHFETAEALFKIYFGDANSLLHKNNWWNQTNDHNRVIHAGVLGDEKNFKKNGALDPKRVTKSLNNWVINLAKVGFHLCSNT